MHLFNQARTNTSGLHAYMLAWFRRRVFLRSPSVPPLEWPLGLPWIYTIWAVVLAILYVPCRWFAGVKERHRGGWLSYL